VEGIIVMSGSRVATAERVAQLYARHRDGVLRTALRYAAGDRALAEDVTHDVFVRLLGAIDRLDEDESLGGWFYRVTVNVSLARLERERIRRSVLGLLGLERPQSSTPERDLGTKKELVRVLDTLAALPPKERVVMMMMHFDGHTQAEIARILGHSKGYVSKLADRAHARVRAAGWEVGDG
jgi:RNA polymerase sigma-70 factor (ECF subfamily)